ncbi:MAG: MoxR family ATPase [Pseudomonadota bacterium]
MNDAAGSAFTEVQALGQRLSQNIGHVMVGNHDAIQLALVALFSRGHALIEDVPGTGKTTLCQALAQSLGSDFRRIQFTPDLLPTDIVGVNVFNPHDATFVFRPGPVFSPVVLADEINRASPRTQSALLEAMQERQVTVDGQTRPLPEPFAVFATQNPIELEGTFPLPEAQLDRFIVRISLGYLDRSEEERLLERFGATLTPPVLEAVANADEVRGASEAVATVRVSPLVRTYLLDIIEQTRNHQSIRLGASPRAGLLLQRAVQAMAALAGRHYALPDDVKQIAPSVLAHRLTLTSEAEVRGARPVDVVEEILSVLDVPIGDPGES